MNDATKTPDAAGAAASTLSAADAAKRVRRPVVEVVDGKDGKPVERTRQVAIAASEVIAHRDYGTHVVVVTEDGQKFSSADA